MYELSLRHRSSYLLLFISLVGGKLVGQVPGWTLVPDLRIDGTKADLVPVGFIAVMKNGEMAVSQPIDLTIRYFGNDGRDLGRFGRQGSGPGEFLEISSNHVLLNDQLWVFDSRGRRLTGITASQKLLQTILAPIKVTADSKQGADLRALQVGVQVRSWDGGIVMAAGGLSTSQIPPWLERAEGADLLILNTDTTGVTRHLVTSIGGLFKKCRVQVGSTTIQLGDANLCSPATRAYSEDGRRIITLENFNLGDTPKSTYKVTSVTFEGDTTFSATFPDPAPPIEKRILDSLRTAVVAGLSKNPALASAWRNATLPDHYPAAGYVVGGRDGTTWVGLRVTKDGRPWRVLDAKGRVIGSLTVPSNVAISAADLSYVWGVQSDEDGLPTIIRYRLSRGPK